MPKEKLNNYTCKICKQGFKMHKLKHARRGKWPTSRTCESDSCEEEAIRLWREKQYKKKLARIKKETEKKRIVWGFQKRKRRTAKTHYRK